MVVAAAETVIYAVQAGLQLYGALRTAYVDGTRGRTLVLPLPRSRGISLDSAIGFFARARPEIKAEFPRAASLAEAADARELTAEESAEILALYRAYLAVTAPDQPDNDSSRGLLAREELAALARVRQWQDGGFGPDTPSALQRIAGTIVNLAVDYFTLFPGKISDKSPEGRALRKFLEILDDKDFATEAVSSIAPDLMVAVLDTVSANTELFGGGENEQLFVENITRSLAAAAKTKLGDASALERMSASAWLQLTARAVLKGGADTLLSNPKRFLDLDDDESTVLQHVGTSIADLVIGDDRVSLRPLLTASGLTTIAKAVFEAVAENPNVLKVDNQGVKNIIVALAGEVSKMPEPLSKDVFPEVVRLVLEKSAANLDLLWGKRFKSPERHLLVTAAKTLLAQLARRPPSGSGWRPQLTPGQMLTVLETVLDEVIDNPQWLVERAEGADPILATAVRSIVAALRKVDGARLSADAGITVLKSGVKAVTVQLALLDESDDDPARTVIEATLDVIFAAVFDDDAEVAATWKVAKSSVLTAIVDIAFEQLAEFEIDADRLGELRAEILAERSRPGRFDPVDFARRLAARFAA